MSHPEYEVSSGPEVVEALESVGLILDPWQRLVFEYGLAERSDGRWAALEVAEVVARQNGKGDVLMGLEIGALTVLDEELVLHTAHEFKTCQEAFVRLCTFIENSDELRRKFKKPKLSTGQEAVEMVHGGRVRFLARSQSSGRGFTADRIILDEAQILTDAPIRAMLPTLSSVPNPQIWYAGTAGDQNSIQLGRVRQRAIRGGDDSLVYLEWSVDENHYDPADLADWAKANPTMGIRISAEYIAQERAAMSPEGFAAERLGVGTWPLEGGNWVIPEAAWDACADIDGERPQMPTVFAVDVNPERTSGAVCVAGRRSDGVLAVEVVDQMPGTGWIVDRAVELDRKWSPVGWVVDRSGPAGSLVPAFEDAGLMVLVPKSQEVAQAAEGFYDRAIEGSLRHRADYRLTAAVAAAQRYPRGDAWAWSRRLASGDVSTLVAASFAVWGFCTQADGLGQPSAFVV